MEINIFFWPQWNEIILVSLYYSSGGFFYDFTILKFFDDFVWSNIEFFLENVPCYWEECLFYCFRWTILLVAFRCSWFIVLFKFFICIDFLLGVLSILVSTVLKSPTVIVELFVSFSSVQFCFICFRALKLN